MDQPRRSGSAYESPRRLDHPRVVRPFAGPPKLVELPTDHLTCRPCRQGRQPDRPLPRREDRRRRHHALRCGRQSHPPPPRDLCPDGPAALPRRDRRLRSRCFTRRLRQGRRPPAGLASLRRTLRPPLDGPRPVCRFQRQRRRPGDQTGVALSRLPHPRVQCRRAV